MASATKKKKEEEAKEFREEQERLAREQGSNAAGAVPEQRPQAFAETRTDLQSDQFKRRRDRGDLEPMSKEAHDRAASPAQLKKAEREEQYLGPETLKVGARVLITSGDFEGSEAAVTEVEYASFEEKQKAASGDPAIARFAKASSYTVRTRAQGQLTEVTPDQVEAIDQLSGTMAKGA